MMTATETYEIWAPPSSPWSPWVAPVIFTQTHASTDAPLSEPSWPEAGWIENDGATAFIVDLPGRESAEWGMGLAQKGFRPVPLYNSSPGPSDMPAEIVVLGPMSSVVVNMEDLVRILGQATPWVARQDLRPNAPPAFLLDAKRLRGDRPPQEGLFDNRWMVFPQDFPSARFLGQQGIRRVIVLQERREQPKEDLAHVLLRWQEAGIAILTAGVSNLESPSEIRVERPSRFKAAWYRALAILGLRRSSVGGFGSFIPEASSG